MHYIHEYPSMHIYTSAFLLLMILKLKRIFTDMSIVIFFFIDEAGNILSLHVCTLYTHKYVYKCGTVDFQRAKNKAS